jgi:NADPH:quinone reductase-like Zn-dependent oxidoreductase
LKAVRIHAHGGIEQLRYEDSDEPALRSEDDVIVKLKAAAVNRIDLALRAGSAPCDGCLPRILGADGAGIVHAVGARARGVKPGDAVCLFPFYGRRNRAPSGQGEQSRCSNRHLLGAHANGTYAEYVSVPARNCFAIPPGLSFDDGAALPLVYSMAWRMLVTDAALKPGEWVMIVGAGGGIAIAALQLAAALGARVIIASRDEKKLAAARQLGAIHGVPLERGDPFSATRSFTGRRGVDVAVNCVGGATWAGSLAALARGGRLVTCGDLAGTAPRTDLRRVFWNHLTILAAHSATREEFARVLEFFAATRLKPVIDTILPLKEAARAHDRLEHGAQFGKIVLRIGEQAARR